MPESVALLLAYLDRVRRRQRRLALGGVATRALGTLCFAWALAAAAANEGARAAGLLALAIGALLAITLVGLRLRSLRGWASPAGQARRVEELQPELRGALLTVVHRSARPLGSAALLGRLASEIEPSIRQIPPSRVWPGAALRRDLRWLVLGGAALLAAAIALPLGPLDALGSLFADRVASHAATAVASEGPRALIGDITLRYLYPTYTRLDPLEVPNTNGEVHAPPGTRVEIRARTAEPWTTATLVANGVEAPARLTDGRLLQGAFTVGGPGSWHFASDVLPTPDFAIVPDPDLAPTVVIGLSRHLEVAVDQPLALAFNAKDDYGLAKVVVEVTVRGKAAETVLRTPVDWPLSLADAPVVSAATLGLHAGDSARIRVGALDNDEVSGAKMGWSAVVELVVNGAEGSLRQREELRKGLLAALVPPLADFLVDPQPVATTVEAVRAWGEAADHRYAAFDTLVAANAALAAASGAGASFEARVVQNVTAARRDLVAFARGLSSDVLNPKDARRLAELHAANVRSLEMAVYTLDQFQRAAAAQDLMRLVKELAREAGELRDDLPKLTREQALARLDMLTRLYERVQAAAARIERGGIREFLESRGTELEGAMAAARRDIASSDDTAAKRDMERVAQLLEEMAGGVEEARKRQTGDDEALREEMEALREELGQLADEEASLRQQTDAARDRFGESLEEGIKAWERVDRAVAEAERQMADPSIAEAAQHSGGARSAVDDARHDADGLSDSVRARDAETARDRADTLDMTLQRARSRVQSGLRSGDIDPATAARAQQALQAAQKAARDAAKELVGLQSRGQGSTPELAEALQELSGAQRDLARRGQSAAERAQKLEQQLPVDGSQIGKAAQEGAQQAGRAEGALESGDAMGASGAQQAAEDAFRRAQEALDQADSDMRQLQSAGAPGDGDPKGGQGTREGQGSEARHPNDGPGMREIAIPAPEEFQTPEEYRKALLQGMQGDVPDAYKAANRRYYEELVRQ